MINKYLEQLKDMKAASALIALIMIGTGIFLMFNHLFVVWLFCAAVAASGAGFIVKYLFARENRNGWDLISGILYVLFGVIMLTGNMQSRVLGILALEYCLAIWVIITGAMSIGDSFSMKKSGTKGWGWTLAGSIFAIIAGMLFVIFPIINAIIFTEFIGIFAAIMLIVTGFTMLAAALSGKNANKNASVKTD